jgi:hypothetical protein
MRDVAGERDIGNRPQRIGRCLDPDELVLPGCIACRTTSALAMSMTSTRKPHCVAKFSSQWRNDQYITPGTST